MADDRVREVGTLADRVFRSLRRAIVEGDLVPGSKLSEAEVARMHGVSRGPLREAMRRLEEDTLARCLELIEGRPVTVRSHDPRLRAQTSGVVFS